MRLVALNVNNVIPVVKNSKQSNPNSLSNVSPLAKDSFQKSDVNFGSNITAKMRQAFQAGRSAARRYAGQSEDFSEAFARAIESKGLSHSERGVLMEINDHAVARGEYTGSDVDSVLRGNEAALERTQGSIARRAEQERRDASREKPNVDDFLPDWVKHNGGSYP